MPGRRPHLISAAAGNALAASLAALHDELELPGPFPDEVTAEADAAARDVPATPSAELADLREIEFLTIDPEGSRDLDQALHLERTATGGILHYAIADVPAFVTPAGAVDAAARARGETLYAVDGTIPLHPRVLSEGAASLLPGVDRRAFVWRFELDERAEPTQVTLTRAVVRSRRQWSYPEAQRAVDDGSAPAALAALPWFGAARAEREQERGGASLNSPEIEVAATPTGYELRRRATLPIEDWNAQVSLLTGMAAARIMLDGGVGILRTMPAADADDVATFRAQTVALGTPWPSGMGYGEYLRTLRGDDPKTLAIRDAATRLFRGAGYAAFDGTPPADPLQSAIAAPYAHTTAPLRRLVDRWCLVVCEALSNGREVPGWARESLTELPKIMGRSNGLASRLDAASIDRVEAAVLHGRIGRTFRGVALGRRGDGVRVQLDDPLVSVVVDGLEVEPGSTVQVRLQRADIATGEIVMVPASEEAH
ncbi:RNB domain-containing ribonuclease [Microbacterium luticocti]|uniref:RNB domain-containing ribonuclease n=1 Tax=Microbacterium luticocti TaxID=451764 RepID=UPI00040F4F3E|nr:RNB domain-containing ribonuclease [Microbacterium luticocti]